MSNIVSIPASPANYTVGRLGYRVSGVIIHTIVGTLAAADATFQNPARQASAHYGVACDGSVCHRYVAESNIAWHCGRFYPDAANPLANANTIGIEHCDNGQPFAPRSDAEYTCSAQLVREICKRYGIPIDRAHIRMHREVSVNPTACPGTLDINRIVREAAVAPAPIPPPTEDEMLLTGPRVIFVGTLKAFIAGSKYRDPFNDPRLIAAPIPADTPLIVDSYVYSSSPVNSPDLSPVAGNQPGPDSVWWHLKDGSGWVPDAILDTSSAAGAPAPTPPAGTAWKVYDPTVALPPPAPALVAHTHVVGIPFTGTGTGTTGPATP